MVSLDRDELKQLLVRCWMTHDAMWFGEAVRTVGIEGANRMNRSAVRGMAEVEAKRLLRLLGRDGVHDLDGLRTFIEAAREALLGDFMDFRWEWSAEEGSLTVEAGRCFALEGVTAMGVADRYECGIYERIYGWLDALGVACTVEPDALLCTMHHQGTCRRTLQFTFPAP